MRDSTSIGDPILFYHSRCTPPGIVGTARVGSDPYPDPTQFDPNSTYFDPKSTRENPRWVLVDVELDEIWDRTISLAELKENPSLAEMKVVQRGQRLSIQPVTDQEWDAVVAMLIVDGES